MKGGLLLCLWGNDGPIAGYDHVCKGRTLWVAGRLLIKIAYLEKGPFPAIFGAQIIMFYRYHIWSMIE
jgi:hypothetical protein